MKHLILLCVILTLTGCDPNTEKARPPYYSTEPLTEPVLFGSEELKTTNGIAFSPQGTTLYTSRNIERTFDNGRTYAAIFQSDFVEDRWTSPVLLQLEGDWDAYHPVLSIDGIQLFFNTRSHPDSGNASVPHDIWVSTREGTGWGAPSPIEEINSKSYDSYPSLARNGNLYFNSNRPGGAGEMDFYFARFIDGKYQAPINLQEINSPDVENDLVVDPDERFIIFNRYILETRDIDLYITFREKDKWSAPRKLNVVNLEGAWELTPSLSPDGQYFFYELNSRIMQVDLQVLLEDR